MSEEKNLVSFKSEFVELREKLNDDLSRLVEKFGRSPVLESFWPITEIRGTVPGRIRKCANDYSKSYGNASFNSFPFGTPGKYQFKHFVGLYSSDKPEITINKILEEARKYYEATNSYGFDLRTIYILTDKWDRAFQYNIESKLGELYIKGGLRVIVLLYHDYGIQDISLMMEEEIPKNYYFYFICKQMKVGEDARTQLKSILEKPGVPMRWVDELQDLEYCKMFFGSSSYPIIVPDSTDVDDRRYYANPISIGGVNYRITNNWFEKNHDKLRYWVWKQSHFL